MLNQVRRHEAASGSRCQYFCQDISSVPDVLKF